MTAYGKVRGDWRRYRDESKTLVLIEPVTEGIIQLFCQTVILYVVGGPGEYPDEKEGKKFNLLDLHDLIYNDNWTKVLYVLLLASSLVSVGTSFVKVMISIFDLSKLKIFLKASCFLFPARGIQHCLNSVCQASHSGHIQVHGSSLLSLLHDKVLGRFNYSNNFENFRTFLYNHIFYYLYPYRDIHPEMEVLMETYFKEMIKHRIAKFKSAE